MKIRNSSILLMTLVFAILIMPFTASAVVDWTKYGGNPVLERGTSGAWDDEEIERPMVIKEDTNDYRMWYTGSNGTNLAIGYATSSNETGWGKYGSNPVFQPGASGKWDDEHVGHPWIIKDGSNYRMWYAGTDDPNCETNIQIGYATSSNGTTWSRPDPNNPVLPKGSANDWDGQGVMYPTVIYDASGVSPYMMWYVGYNDSIETTGIGYAGSSDGITWYKYDDPTTTADPYANSDPVISLGQDGSWHDETLHSPCVIKEDSLYRMWFTGEDSTAVERIGYAYSIDGINWRQYDGNPVIMPGGSGAFDEIDVADPMVLKDGTTYKMWYRGYDSSGDDSFGYATSSAYQGDPPEINNANIATLNRSFGMHIMMCCIPEGPGPLDINELKVEGPNNFSHTFSDSDMNNWLGNQFIAKAQPKDPVDSGTYTYTVKSNNGQTATKSLSLTASTIPVPQDGSAPGQLNRAVKDYLGSWYEDQVYIGNSVPVFRWKPMTGYTTGYYYRVRIIDWKYNNSWWYASDPQQGMNTDGSGYLYAQVPSGILKDNTPYHWQVEVMDTNNVWSAHNRAWSDWRHIYTGTKSGTADFLNDSWGKAGLVSERSFRNGNRAFFWAFVQNLAPWDIELDSPNQFRVRDPSNNPFHYFDIVNDSFYTDPYPFMYYSSEQGLPDAGEYDFLVYEDGTLNYETHTINLARDDSVPQVTKDEMHHENIVTRIDNAYLPYADPELFWKSKGPGYWHRVMIFDWNSRRFVWRSNYLNSVSAGSDMSAKVPQGALKENNPYRWWVEVYDSTRQNRTRSQWLSFMTGPAGAPGRFLPAVYLLLLLGD
jgi:predicted GH43/DUF377 family glycosyl hydrolase